MVCGIHPRDLGTGSGIPQKQGTTGISWQERETFTYVDFLADFRGTFHDIRNDNALEIVWTQTATGTHNIWPENF